MDAPSLMQAISNMALITQNSRDLPREAQNEIANFFGKVADKIATYTQYMTPEDAQAGANSQLDLPVPFDVTTDFRDMDYDTDIDSEEPLEVDSGDQLEALSAFDTRKKQEDVVSLFETTIVLVSPEMKLLYNVNFRCMIWHPFCHAEATPLRLILKHADYLHAYPKS
ncbi:unnamed protein product [Dibothriocephalus latus]|uniref:Uncharacterized protein n=1 Tax=Dibothriocephalus latus TaxID=60516 RepID=A0A3P7P3C2_DIBLA|nr:unnamed protein product [Dibothriocephalus latus]